ncbi:MAG TPA: class I SAM-dependent methyltransferase [Polyangiales bacterium]
MTQIIECIPPLHGSSNPELGALKLKQQAMWASGDFAVIGTTLQPVGEALCEAADLQAGSIVLDVACGNGNATLAAARRFCNVTGIDYVPTLLARATERAHAERLAPSFMEGDAEALPFADAIFDAALSTFGVMFAADQARAARELVRVVKPGGKIALASWTPEGFLGDLLRTVAHYVAPPKGAASPLRWGTTPGLAHLFDIGREVVVEHAQRRSFVFRYESPAHFVDVFRRCYGPTRKAFEALDAQHQGALERELIELLRAHNQSRSALAVPGQYLEVVLQKLPGSSHR